MWLVTTWGIKQMNRKMLVHAFAKIAKRWGDSAKTPYTFSMYGYKNARAWGRIMADNYESEMLEAYADWIDTPLIVSILVILIFIVLSSVSLQ